MKGSICGSTNVRNWKDAGVTKKMSKREWEHLRHLQRTKKRLNHIAASIPPTDFTPRLKKKA